MKPFCKQCEKSRRTCPGYRDAFDLVFRNETQATERRARRSNLKHKVHAQGHGVQFQHKRASSSGLGEGSAGGAGVIRFQHETFQQQTTVLEPVEEVIRYDGAVAWTARSPDGMVSVPDAIPASIEQQAFCYFLSNFVLMPRQGTVGYLDFLVPLYNADQTRSHLSSAFSAVALAALASRPNSRRLFPTALKQYDVALRSTNKALADPVQQKQDQTLAAVLLLGLFEVRIPDCWPTNLR